MTTIIVIAVVVNFILSLLVANMGSKRQLGSVGAFFLSFLFSPILGMLFVIASERLTAEEIRKREESKKEVSNSYKEEWGLGKLFFIVGLIVFMAVTVVLMFNS